MTAAEREREAQWYEQNANAYNALGADGQSTVQRANDAANRWDIANNMYPWMLDTSGLGMPIDQQLAMADAYEERRQATAALEQAANSRRRTWTLVRSRAMRSSWKTRGTRRNWKPPRARAQAKPDTAQRGKRGGKRMESASCAGLCEAVGAKYIYRRLRAHRREYARANDEYLPGRGAGRNGPQH